MTSFVKNTPGVKCGQGSLSAICYIYPNASGVGFYVANRSVMEITNTSTALARYRKKLESLAPISDDDFRNLAGTLREKHFNRGEVLLKEGQVSREYYFIISGCIRSFGLEDGREVNVKFYFEDDTACDFASFRSEQPSHFYLVAMEDTVVFHATKTEAGPVFENGVSLHMLLFRFFQDLYLKEEEHSNIRRIHRIRGQ